MDLSFNYVGLVCHGERSVSGTYEDMYNLPFKRESFGVVVSNSTLEPFQTLKESTASLRELHGVLPRIGSSS